MSNAGNTGRQIHAIKQCKHPDQELVCYSLETGDEGRRKEEEQRSIYLWSCVM